MRHPEFKLYHHPPLCSGQPRQRWPLGPIRPRVGTHDPAARRGPKDGTGRSSGQRSTASTAARWQSQQLTESERTPLARTLPSVMGIVGAGERVMQAFAGVGAAKDELH